MKVFSVFDSKAEAFLQPFFSQTAGVAMRMFGTAALDESHDFCRYGEDYTLFEIGEFDEKSGFLEACTPKSHGNALVIGAALSGGDRG